MRLTNFVYKSKGILVLAYSTFLITYSFYSALLTHFKNKCFPFDVQTESAYKLLRMEHYSGESYSNPVSRKYATLSRHVT